VLKERLPGCALVLSTTTVSGQAQARKLADRRTACVYAPLDLPFAVRSALNRIRPDLLAICETEIWPNWLMEARTLGVPTALINGRISLRSFRRYRRIRSLIGPVLNSFRALSMISDADAGRIRRLGADRRRVCINGNAKYDGLVEQADQADAVRMARLLCLDKDAPVLVAGSVRGGELSPVIDAFLRIRSHVTGAVLVVAPRHLENAAVLSAAAEKRGLPVQRRSAIGSSGAERTAPVVVLDTYGELMAVYGIASVVFCGGSLVPLGGQNVLEPAAWGKTVLYGPSMEDFADARELLERKGGGETVTDGEHLAERALYFLSHPAEAAAAGQRALAAAASQQGAGRRHAEVILELLKNR
jgi:3-deoxy-D-manno-octulosonic-acid transferase